MRWNKGLAAAAAAALLPAATFAAANAPGKAQLAPPVQVQAEGGPIDVEVGHAAPYLADFDGDGTRDLLVGQFGGGKLRIYKNQGTDAEPRFAQYEWFKAGADLGTVPAS
jgi:opacity protein-like surface antigen